MKWSVAILYKNSKLYPKFKLDIMKRYYFCILSRKSHLQSHLSLVLHFELTQTWIREGVSQEAAFTEQVSSLYYQTAFEALNNTVSPWKRDVQILFKNSVKNIHNKQVLELMPLPLGAISTNPRILLHEAISQWAFCISRYSNCVQWLQGINTYNKAQT